MHHVILFCYLKTIGRIHFCHHCRCWFVYSCPKKVFRGFEFLEKHLLNKHPKEVDAVKESAYLEQSLANFLADPRRIHVGHSSFSYLETFSPCFYI